MKMKLRMIMITLSSKHSGYETGYIWSISYFFYKNIISYKNTQGCEERSKNILSFFQGLFGKNFKKLPLSAKPYYVLCKNLKYQ